MAVAAPSGAAMGVLAPAWFRPRLVDVVNGLKSREMKLGIEVAISTAKRRMVAVKMRVGERSGVAVGGRRVGLRWRGLRWTVSSIIKLVVVAVVMVVVLVLV